MGPALIAFQGKLRRISRQAAAHFKASCGAFQGKLRRISRQAAAHFKASCDE
jgi:hypothetical protein